MYIRVRPFVTRLRPLAELCNGDEFYDLFFRFSWCETRCTFVGPSDIC